MMTLLEAPKHSWNYLHTSRLQVWSGVDLFRRPLRISILNTAADGAAMLLTLHALPVIVERTGPPSAGVSGHLGWPLPFLRVSVVFGSLRAPLRLLEERTVPPSAGLT